MTYEGTRDIASGIDLSQYGATSSTPPIETGVSGGAGEPSWLEKLLSRSQGTEDTTLPVETANVEAAGLITGTLAKVATTAIQAGAQSSQMDKVRQQELAQAEEKAALYGKQDDISFRFKKEGLRQEKKVQELRELQNSYVQRFNAFTRSFKKGQQTHQQQQKLFKGLSQKASQNDNLANIMINNWSK